ncbi:family 10 glycosylhydrolase [candidate division WOR-3 bacterium]|nr:family 10 glycosylhydrolase [candidate division WOR-3 bacterium]
MNRHSTYASMNLCRRIIAFLLVSLTMLTCAKKQLVLAPVEPALDTLPVIVPPASFQRGMWVRAVSIASADSIARIIAIAKEMRITDLYVQTVVAGYAYYQSSILPRSQYLAGVSPPEYDPLDSLTKVAHAESLRVHAWVNALLVWSLKNPPDSARHVFYTHPEWFIKDIAGRSMHDYTYEQWLDAGLEGLYLDPACPAVQQHIADICGEIVSEYPVAGIHLDFIRYPGTLWGVQETDTACLLTGLEGYQVRWLNLIRYPQMTFIQRWLAWHNWKHYSNKKQKIDDIVAKTWNVITQSSMHPAIILTTAIFADPGMRLYRFAQDWPAWTMVAYPLVMSYYEELGPFMNILTYTRSIAPDAVYGIGLLWENIDAVAFMQSACVEKDQRKGICYFDFTNLDTLVDRSVLMGKEMAFSPASSESDSTPKIINGVFAYLPPPALIQNSILSSGPIDTSFVEFLLSLSMDPDDDMLRLGLSMERFGHYVNTDITAFKTLDAHIFPLPDTLIQPPFRTLRFEFFPWNGQDSMAVIRKANKTKNYSQEVTSAPSALDPLSRAAFAMNINEKKTIKTRAGVYAIMMISETNGDSKVARTHIPDYLLPYYLSWTAIDRACTIVGDKY